MTRRSLSGWDHKPELRSAAVVGRHPFDVFTGALTAELTPQGWQIMAYLDRLDLTCPRGGQFTVTARTHGGEATQWLLQHEKNDSISITLTEPVSLAAAHYAASGLRFLSYQFSQLHHGRPPLGSGEPEQETAS